MKANEYELIFSALARENELQWIDGPRFLIRGSTRRSPQDGRWLTLPRRMIFEANGRPASEHDAFLKFCELEECETAFLGFAKVYGVLGIGESVPTQGRRGVYGESFERWVEEIRYMRDARDLAFALQAGTRSKLKTWLTIDLGSQSLSEDLLHGHTPRLPSVSFCGDAGTPIRVQNVKIKANRWVRAAKLVLAQMINAKFSDRVAVQAVVRGHELERRITVETLLAELWTQFLDSYADRRIFFCAACGKPNSRAPQDPDKRKPRSDRTLCPGSKCKSRARRQRLKKGAKRGA